MPFSAGHAIASGRCCIVIPARSHVFSCSPSLDPFQDYESEDEGNGSCPTYHFLCTCICESELTRLPRQHGPP